MNSRSLIAGVLASPSIFSPAPAEINSGGGWSSGGDFSSHGCFEALLATPPTVCAKVGDHHSKERVSFPESLKKHLSDMPPILVALMAVAIVVMVMTLLKGIGNSRRKSKAKYLTGQNLRNAGSPREALSDFRSVPRSQTFHQSLMQVAGSCENSEIRSFLEEIARRVDPDIPLDATTPLGFIEELVDRVDDLALIRANADEMDLIKRFSDVLLDILKACEVELLREKCWNPSVQRAISKTPTPGISCPEISGLGSSGISREGKIIRKQEVQLAIPIQP